MIWTSLALQSLITFFLLLICFQNIIIEYLAECLVYSFFTILYSVWQVFYLLVGQANLQCLLLGSFKANYQRHNQIIPNKQHHYTHSSFNKPAAIIQIYLYFGILNIFDQLQQQQDWQMQCPTHVKKLQKISAAKSDPCQICGRAAYYQCKSCSFVQCDQCRICNKRHGLVKIVELSKLKPEYFNNGYSCNSCSKSKNVDDDGIWHCNTCNYDLCPDCAE